MAVLKFFAKALVVILALVGTFVVVCVVGLILAWRSLPGMTATPPPATAVLTFDLADGLTEAGSDNPLSFAGLGKSIIMRDAVRGIEAAAKDDRIKVLLLHLGSGDLDLAHAQELADAIADFRHAGKFALAFAESFGEGGSAGSHYMLALSANEIWLQPSGDLALVGAAIQTPFFRTVLDKLGVVARMDHREEFKGAIYSLTDSSMPEPQRANMQALVDSWTAQMADAMAKGRHMDTAHARQSIDGGPYAAAAAKSAGLIDTVAYWDQAQAAALKHAGTDAKTFALADYIAALPAPPADSPKIAVIYGVGDVTLGGGQGNPLFGGYSMGSKSIADALHKAIDDTAISGIIFRIDSPGGSYVAADEIWREVQRAREKGKPLVVSMAGEAASGGYFAAAPAAAIVAEPATITGSIGVFSGKIIFADLLNKLGVTVDNVSSGRNALIDSPTVDYTPQQWAQLEADLDRVYGDFLDKVAAGRHMSRDAVRAVAKGQIWSGLDAKQRGLVDALGGFNTAVELLRPLAKIEPSTPVVLEQYPPSADKLHAIARLFGLGGSDTALVAPLAEFVRVAAPLLVAIESLMGTNADERLRAPIP
jgi:protease IV